MQQPFSTMLINMAALIPIVDIHTLKHIVRFGGHIVSIKTDNLGFISAFIEMHCPEISYIVEEIQIVNSNELKSYYKYPLRHHIFALCEPPHSTWSIGKLNVY